MTAAMSILLNLITLVESGKAEFKLDISRTYYDPEDFVPRKKVRVDGSEVCVVDLADLMEASKDWPELQHKIIEKYMPPPRDGFVSEEP